MGRGATSSIIILVIKSLKCHVAGLDGDLDAVAAVDTLGRDLQGAALPRGARAKTTM